MIYIYSCSYESYCLVEEERESKLPHIDHQIYIDHRALRKCVYTKKFNRISKYLTQDDIRGSDGLYILI